MARFAQQPGAPGAQQLPPGGVSYEMAQELAARGIEPVGADAMVRRRVPDRVLTLTDDDLADTVKVVCFVDTQPWTHERPLALGEQAVVPRKVADEMVKRHQVTIVTE